MDEEPKLYPIFENILFSVLGGMCSVIFSLSVFSSPEEGLHRELASYSEHPTPAPEDFNPELYRGFFLE